MQTTHPQDYASSLSLFADLVQRLQIPSANQVDVSNRLNAEFSSQLLFLINVLNDPQASITLKYYASSFIKEQVSKRREFFPEMVTQNLLHILLHSSHLDIIQSQVSHILALIAKKNIHFLPYGSGKGSMNPSDSNATDSVTGNSNASETSSNPLNTKYSMSRGPNAQKDAKIAFVLQWKGIIHQLLNSNGHLGMHFVQVLCVEFSSHKISNIRLSFAENEESRKLFQEYLLEEIFLLTMNVIENHAEDIKCLITSFNILQCILTWDFSASHSLYRNRFLREKKNDSDGFAPPKLSPVSDFWSTNLTNLHFIDLLVRFLNKYNSSDQISHPIRQCLIRLSQMCPTSMSSMLSLTASGLFYSRIFNVHLELCTRGISTFSTEENALDILCGAEGLKNLFLSLPLGQLFSLQGIENYMEQLSSITSSLLSLSSVSMDEIIQESLDYLLLAWEFIMSKVEQFESASIQGSVDKSYTQQIQSFSQKIVNVCAPQITKEFITSQILSISRELKFDHCTDDRMRSARALSRMCIPFSIAIMKNFMEERFGYLASSTSNDPNSLNQKYSIEVAWLLKYFSLIISDNCDSEQTYIPPTILTYVSSREGIAFIQIVQMILKFAEIENQRITQQNLGSFHPTVSEAIAQFLSHFISAYVMIDPSEYEDIPQLIIENWGHNENGRRIATFLLQKVIVNIFYLHCGDALANSTCKLLSSIVDHTYIRDYLITTPIWEEFLTQDSKTFTTLDHHSNTIKSKITELLCRACIGLKSEGPKAISNYFSKIFYPIQHQFYSILQDKNFEHNFSDESVRIKIDYCLSKCIGVARASDIGIWEAIYSFFTQYDLFSTFTKLIQIYPRYLQIETSLFKFYSSLLDKTSVFLNPEQFSIVSESFLRGVRSFVEQMRGTTFNDNLKDENEFKKCIILVMQVLAQTMGRDVFSEVEESNAIVEILFQGLSHLVMLITSDMLDYPKLRREYFALISSMMDIYPSYILQMPHEVIQRIFELLNFGISHFEPDIVRWSYQGIRSFAYEIVRMVRDKGSAPDLSRYSRALLQITLKQLLFENLDQSVINDLARGLLALIFWDFSSYQAIVSDLIQSNPDRKLKEAFTILQDNISNAIDNSKNDEVFAKNLSKFIQMAQFIA